MQPAQQMCRRLKTPSFIALFIYFLSFFVVWILDTALLDVRHPLLFAAGVSLLVRYNDSPAGHRSGCPVTGPPPSLLVVLNKPRDTAVATAKVVDVFTRAAVNKMWKIQLQFEVRMLELCILILSKYFFKPHFREYQLNLAYHSQIGKSLRFVIFSYKWHWYHSWRPFF